uniref:Col_cuticle_N domain-containing protein n=1 Tax=Steinernema glaseri TaxID=37863 RepID=A0A1I8APD5_9BILA
MISLFQMNVCLAIFTTTVAILALGLLIYVLITNNHNMVHAAQLDKDLENPNNNQIYKPKSDEVIDIEDRGFAKMRSERAVKELTLKRSPEDQVKVAAASQISEAQYDDPIEESNEGEKYEVKTIEPPFEKRLVQPECSPNEGDADTRC